MPTPTPLSPTVASIRMAVAKLHAVTVTQADLHYVGSITIDADLVDAAGMVPFQMVQITNQSTGAFWQTYVILGERGSGIIGLNGAPARHFLPGDKAYIVAEGQVEPSRLAEHALNVVFVDGRNRVTRIERQHADGSVAAEVRA
ncbi:MAG: aspartate 1-decarboxylase [Planctomycetota bacterium]|jgi:aspartate 1-decarboxylase